MAKHRPNPAGETGAAETPLDNEQEVVQLAREIFVHRGATPNGFTPERVAKDAFKQAEAFIRERQSRQNPTD